MEFQCHVDKLDQNVVGVSSPSHPIKIDISNPETFLVSFSQQSVQLDRDIIIDIELSQMKTRTIAAVEKGALMVSFMPNEQDCQQNMNNAANEFLFVIDCSGSMDDDNKIGLARKAMMLFLKSLPINCKFNIIRFGTNFSSLFNKNASVEYNENTMARAESLIRNLSANMGGTELVQPLVWLQKNKPNEGCMRQIFLLTDGQVSNVPQVTNLCSEMAAYTRIFSFGLGHSPSRALVKGLARATNGHFIFIPPNTNADIYVAEQLARALQPSLTNTIIKWKTNQTVLHSVSAHASPIFFGDRILFYALLDESMPFDESTTVEITCKERSEPISIVSIQESISNYNPQTITRLAAKAVLRELQNPSQNTPKELLIDLSIKYGVLCPYTAFIGVEKRFDANSESNADMELHEVAIMPEPIYQRLQTQSTRLDYVSAPFGKSAKKSSIGVGSLFQPFAKFATSFLARKRDNSRINTTPYSNDQSQPKSVADWSTNEQQLVEFFIERQQFDGLWKLTEDDVMKLTSQSCADFSSSLLDKVEKNNQYLIVTTILTIVILEKRCASSKTLWQALSNKAEKRLLELLGGNQTELKQLIEYIRAQLI
ncbi:hypothetical protein I4U23_016973 [Adineta vaga]|nr:hypothetical protein I4U23_016973 [Adineta vaga]